MAKKKKPKPEKQSPGKNEFFNKQQIVNASVKELKQLVWGYKTDDGNFLCIDCDRCKQCIGCFSCASSCNLKYCFYCVDSEDLTDCSQMVSCSFCFKSSGHENKSFIFCDIELSESEYTDAINKLMRE